jgi:protein-tyrosine-phosphatase
MPAILFVCTANICRSPMASAIFNELLKENQASGEWQVESAGTWALDGQPAAQGSQSVLAERGLDISDHRSRSVGRELLQSFDLILTMEWGHEEAMRHEFPEVASRIHLLSEMANQSGNVDDPYGGPASGYEETAAQIEQLLRIGYEKIIRLAAAEKE